LELSALEDLGSLLVTWGARMRDAVPHLEDALRLAEELADGPARVSILNRLSVVHSNRLRFDQARLHSERALGLAAQLDDERVLAAAMDGAKTVAAYLGDFPTLRETLPRLADILRRHGDLWYLQWAVFDSSIPHLAEGRREPAESAVEEALALNRQIGDRAQEPYFLAALGWLHRAAGDYGRALAAGREATALAVALEHPWWIGWSEGLFGWTLLERSSSQRRERLRHRGTVNSHVRHFFAGVRGES
jgi:tetratricopeptide (TPR) repeat protein